MAMSTRTNAYAKDEAAVWCAGRLAEDLSARLGGLRTGSEAANACLPDLSGPLDALRACGVLRAVLPHAMGGVIWASHPGPRDCSATFFGGSAGSILPSRASTRATSEPSFGPRPLSTFRLRTMSGGCRQLVSAGECAAG